MSDAVGGSTLLISPYADDLNNTTAQFNAAWTGGHYSTLKSKLNAYGDAYFIGSQFNEDDFVKVKFIWDDSDLYSGSRIKYILNFSDSNTYVCGCGFVLQHKRTDPNLAVGGLTFLSGNV